MTHDDDLPLEVQGRTFYFPRRPGRYIRKLSRLAAGLERGPEEASVAMQLMVEMLGKEKAMELFELISLDEVRALASDIKRLYDPEGKAQQFQKQAAKAYGRLSKKVAERISALTPPEDREALDQALAEGRWDIFGDGDVIVVRVLGKEYRIPRGYEPPTGDPGSN